MPLPLGKGGKPKPKLKLKSKLNLNEAPVELWSSNLIAFICQSNSQ